MPANNKKSEQAKKSPASKLTESPGLIFRKVLQDALIDGYEDPVSFCRDFLDFEPYEGQQIYLRATRDTEEDNLTGGNRTGKSLIASAKLLWRGTYRHTPPSLTPPETSRYVDYKALHASLTLDQANIVFNYVTGFANSKKFKPFVKNTLYSPFPEMELRVRNEFGDQVSSYLWARSMSNGGRFLLGHSFGYASTDECAFQPDYTEIENNVIKMRLADQGGALSRFSTPNGVNHFYKYYLEGLSGKPGLYSQTISTWENPKISRKFLESQKERYGEDSYYYRQNILGQFVSATDFFITEHINALYSGVEYLDKKDNPLTPQLPIPPERGAQYIMSADLGSAQDPTVVMVARIDQEGPAKLVYVGESVNPRWQTQRAFIANIWHTYNPIQTVVDASGVGASPAQDLLEVDGLLNTEPFIFTSTSKPVVLTKLQDAVQQRKFIFPYVNQTQKLVEQLGYYKLDDKRIAQDYVMAFALLNIALEKVKRQGYINTEIFDDLMAISVYGGGEAVSGADTYGPGTIFTYDVRSGLYVPAGDTNEYF